MSDASHTTGWRDDGPADAPATLLLAHGAGAPMDSPFMEAMAAAIAAHGIRVRRFEFGYMAARRAGGPKRPPPRVERLAEEYRAVIDGQERGPALFIAGKSMGGRVASLVAQDAWASGRVSGLVCLGYPFHPPGKPENLRTAHLADLAAPALICQGERDPFGTRAEVAGYRLAPAVALHWARDGDHDLAPRKASGRTAEQNWADAAAAVAAFIAEVTRGK